MSITEKFKQSFKSIKKLILLALIPVGLDIFNLVLFENIFKTAYIPMNRSFVFKLGVISTPPSVKYILEDFPSAVFTYNSNTGFTGIISSISLLNIFLILVFFLITSFITSGYLVCLEKAGRENIRIKDFFIEGNKYWFKIFILNLINIIPLMLMFIDISFIMVSFLFVILYYVKFAVVVDKDTLKNNFRKGINIFMENLWITVKLALYCGFIFVFLSIIMFMLARLGKIGIIIDIFITSYLGMAFNKCALEIYRDKSKGYSKI